LRFEAARDGSPEELLELSKLAPANPFCTAGFVDARRAEGEQAWILGLRNGCSLVAGCVGFVSTGRLSRMMEIQSLPTLPTLGAGDMFWQGVLDVCRRHGIARLRALSFGSKMVTIPKLGRELWRKPRTEYVLDLDRSLWSALSSNHKRSIRRARSAGVVVRRETDPARLEVHANLIGASMARRRDRGEAVAVETNTRAISGYASHGIAELYQAQIAGSAVSSVLLLAAPSGCYYHSAGTSPEGMEVGASQFLIQSVADMLRDRGHREFNLGGADDDQPGLARFKSGFGARSVASESAEFALGGVLPAVLRGALRSMTRH
jgi:hypothetical protein